MSDRDQVGSEEEESDQEGDFYFQIDDLKKDPSYKGKTTLTEVTDRTTRQGQAQTGAQSQTGAKSQTSVSSGSSSSKVSKSVSSSRSGAKMDVETRKFLGELKDVFTDVASQNKKDNVMSLNDLPYFVIKPSEAVKKWIVPQEDSELFLDLLDKQTEDIDFTEKGRIRVLKTHLLGNALNYWKSFKGNTWVEAKAFLMARYPNINDFCSYMDRVKALKRKPSEQFVDFATRVEDAWDRVQKESNGTMSDEQVLKDKKLTLAAACPDEMRNFIDVCKVDVTYEMALSAIIKWLELNKQYKLTRADIDKVKGSPAVKQVAATVDKTVADQGKVTKQSDPVQSSAKVANNKKKGKNKHFGLTCYYCNKRNHIAQNCRTRIAKEGDPNAKTTAAPGAANTGGTTASKAGDGSAKSGPVKCYNCGGEWHLASTCLKPKAGF